MDFKKIGLALIVLCMFFGLSIAGNIIGSGTLSRADRTIEIDKETETPIKEWYQNQGIQLTNLTVEYGELHCDGKLTLKSVCVFSIDNNLFHTTLTINENKCNDFSVTTGECLQVIEKTDTELKTSQDDKYKARLESVKKASEKRIAKTKIAKIGESTITVNAK